ncbi:hypothetical protein MKW98_014133 [Papaver atlanticum]|uniref:Carboxypeptidase n=1 Tax=Papaver atlanticum TaxID=357466 RepID=A0AAD4XGX4_9MAGN|nr:hypothetical protein MKW98_014133 [Papaver atlanticum]
MSVVLRGKIWIECINYQGNVNFAHYSGYVDVNKDKALFYWFFEAVENPSSKPLLLWLNGGPGCSSIAYGESEEIGPFHIRPDGKTLYQNPYSWNQVANGLFLDSPVGVGFSYSNKSEDLLNNGDASTAEDSLAFLSNWLERFPQYKGREFYLSGESYAGHYVPQLAEAIVKQAGDKSINLKGYTVGNAVTDDYHDDLGIIQFMWSTGLISDQTHKLLNAYCDSESSTHPSSECNKILDVADKENGNIDAYSIYTPSCTATGSRLSLNHLRRRFHESINLKANKRGASNLDVQVGGWTQGYEGLTFVSVRGAGHEVPLHKPKLALTLVKAFLSGSAMPSLSVQHADP